MNLTFNADTHEYFVDEVKVPCVSDIMQAEGLIDFGSIPEDKLAYASARGTAVHSACEYYDINTLDFDSLNGPILPYFNAWVDFCNDYNPKWLMIETPLYSPDYGYAGTLDRVGLIGGVPYVIDIKSGQKRKEHRIQTAAYALLVEQHPDLERACVYLDKEGRYKFVGYDNPQDEIVFLSALTLYQFKKGGRKNANVTGFINPASLNSSVG